MIGVVYYSDGTRTVITDRASWLAAPPTGVVMCAWVHADLGYYIEGYPEPKARTRPGSSPWALQSGGFETWPMGQPRPWLTDAFGCWQDLVRDGVLASSTPFSSLTRQDLSDAGVKFWEDMAEAAWQPVLGRRKVDERDGVLPRWGRR